MAITFGKYVFICGEYFNDKKLLKHEQVHIEQYKREGFIRFLIMYVYYCCRFGYWNNPYEIEARNG
jgi:hypothetical protein